VIRRAVAHQQIVIERQSRCLLRHERGCQQSEAAGGTRECANGNVQNVVHNVSRVEKAIPEAEREVSDFETGE
jgi:hypothetical protein